MQAWCMQSQLGHIMHIMEYGCSSLAKIAWRLHTVHFKEGDSLRRYYLICHWCGFPWHHVDSSDLPICLHAVWRTQTYKIKDTTFISQEIRAYNTKLSVHTLWSRWGINLIPIERTWIPVTRRGKILYFHKQRKFINLFKKSQLCTLPQDTWILVIFNPIFSNISPHFTHKYTFSPLHFIMMLALYKL
jgi:hypothetical protein